MEVLSLQKHPVIPLSDGSTVSISAARGIDFYVEMADSNALGAPGAGNNGQRILVAIKTSIRARSHRP